MKENNTVKKLFFFRKKKLFMYSNFHPDRFHFFNDNLKEKHLSFFEQ